MPQFNYREWEAANKRRARIREFAVNAAILVCALGIVVAALWLTGVR